MRVKHVLLPGLALALFTLLCNASTMVADFYATRVYPLLSCVMSWIASFTRFSLQDLAILLILSASVAIAGVGLRRKWGYKRSLKYIGCIVLWTYVWFYIGWCCNYYRSNLYARTSTTISVCNDTVFTQFAKTFVRQTNESWTSEFDIEQEQLEADIKQFYANVPPLYGLAKPHTWQHPKQTIFNGVYASMGIQGFMEPLFAESCIIQEVPDIDRPFVYAHEYAHLLGISSEAECNWWAFHACTASAHKAIRYSGYKGILNFVMSNAQTMLNKEEYKKLASELSPRVKADVEQTRRHWEAIVSPSIRRFHKSIYDAFLKSNKIETGIRNYSEVIMLLLNIKLKINK